MARSTEPLLAWLRGRMTKDKLNTAALADQCGVPRARMKKILAGAEEMTVTELLAITEHLAVTPEEFAMPLPELPKSGPTLAVAEANATEDVVIDPFGNQPEQLVKAAFALGCDFLCVIDGGQLEGSGVPRDVIQQFAGRDLPIRMDAAYHRYNDPKYTPAAFTVTLSFDALYDCTFPWSAVKQVAFWPIPPDPEPEPEPEPEPKKGRPSFLRLVE